MKLIKYFLFTVFCAVFCFACKSNNENETLSSLKGTQWKLAGIVDSQTGKLTVLEPTDCEECYTLTFDTDSTASVHVITSTFKLDLSNLNPYVNFEDILRYEQYNGENYEINTFCNNVIAAASFIVDSKQLRLYNLGGNYLLFKRF